MWTRGTKISERERLISRVFPSLGSLAAVVSRGGLSIRYGPIRETPWGKEILADARGAPNTRLASPHGKFAEFWGGPEVYGLCQKGREKLPSSCGAQERKSALVGVPIISSK